MALRFPRKLLLRTASLLGLLLLVAAPPGPVVQVDAFSVQASPCSVGTTSSKARTSSPPVYISLLPRISVARRKKPWLSTLLQSSSSPEDPSNKNDGDQLFDGRTTAALVAGQSLLVVASVIAALIVGTPNFGLGPGIEFSWNALQLGTLLALPLGALAAALDLIEDQVPALQDVTKATQRSVLALMGGTFKPAFALVTAIALGLAAGFGEEMLFRGVLQYEIASRFFGGAVTGVTLSSIVFGALHAVTPLYAGLATIASVYFGSIYLWSDNLAVPIACHTVYDIGALFYAHWTVCQLPLAEKKALATWEGPGSDKVDIL